jgi:hypothetical protein
VVHRTLAVIQRRDLDRHVRGSWLDVRWLRRRGPAAFLDRALATAIVVLQPQRADSAHVVDGSKVVQGMS